MAIRDINFLMAITAAHKVWAGGRDCALLFDTRRDDMWFVDGLASSSAARSYDTAAVLVLQNLSVADCDGKWLFCTYPPTEMCLGMAWSRQLRRVYYIDGATIRYAAATDAAADAGYPSAVDAGRDITIARDGSPGPEAIGVWTNLAWTAAWWGTMRASFMNALPFSVVRSYEGAVGNPRKNFVARPATPALLGRGVPGAIAGAIENSMRDKLFMAIAQTLVARTLNVSDADPRTAGGRAAGHNIGALLVSQTNQILGWGVNMVAEHGTFHAETAMVQSYLTRTNTNRLPLHSRIYTTVRPCHMCAGFIAVVGNRTTVVYGQPDTRITRNALSRPGVAARERLSDLALPDAHPGRGPGADASIAAILERLRRSRHIGSVVAFLYSDVARTFFGAIAGQPAVLLRLLQDIDAPTPNAMITVVEPRAIPSAVLARMTPMRQALATRTPLGPRTLVRVGGALNRGIDALDLATYHPAAVAAARRNPGDDALEFRPRVAPLIEILAAGHALLTTLRAAGLAA